MSPIISMWTNFEIYNTCLIEIFINDNRHLLSVEATALYIRS